MSAAPRRAGARVAKAAAPVPAGAEPNTPSGIGSAVAGAPRARDVLVCELGPRAGLQDLGGVMPTAAKIAWIDAAAAAGLAAIEVGAFAPAAPRPQLADSAELVAHARAIAGLTVAVRVFDRTGAAAALAGGAHKIVVALAVSESYGMRHGGRDQAQALAELRGIGELVNALPAPQRPHLEGSLCAAFGCPQEGAVSERRVLELAVALMEAGCHEIGLADSGGSANPAQVRRLIRGVWSAVGRHQLTSVALSDARGLGLANALAALDVGLTGFDAVLGGLGSAAAGAALVTEDLVFMCEAMGLRTGVDLPALLALREQLGRALPGEPLRGMTALAGLPPGFVAASLRPPAP